MSKSRTQKVLDRLGIEYRRHGSEEWIAHCPNPDHDDKHPSWRIRDAEGEERDGYHNCFSCGFGGDIVQLVMAVEFLRHRQAMEWLESPELAPAIPANVEVVTLSLARRKRIVLPQGVVQLPLERWLTSPRVYALGRGLTAEQVERWGLGYAVDGRMAGRIVIPWCDEQGVLGSYTGRDYYGTSRRKYLQAAPEEGVDPTIMFGERHWQGETLVVTEGELNALAVERALPHYAVAALSGSNINASHVAKVAGRFGEVIQAFDPDAAGSKVTKEFARMIQRHATVREARFPPGVDVCDLEKEMGPKAVRTTILHAIDASYD